MVGTAVNKEDIDARSVFVGNVRSRRARVANARRLTRGARLICLHCMFAQVDFSTTVEELQAHFQSCGVINRVTILADRGGHAKGYLSPPCVASVSWACAEPVFFLSPPTHGAPR